LATFARDREQRPLFDRPERPWLWSIDPETRVWFKPWLWAAIGLMVSMVAWVVGWLGYWLGQSNLAWLGSDYNLMWGLPCLGFGLGQLSRFNALLPDLPRSSSYSAQMPSLSTPIALNGLKSLPIAIEGQLQGRSGLSNGLGQDLWFVTENGDWVPLKLNTTTGPIGLILARLFNQTSIAAAMLSKSAQVSVRLSGWLRQGVTPWIDAEMLQSGKSKLICHHQTATIALGALAIGLGCFMIL
jgi:hypothetical protein